MFLCLGMGYKLLLKINLFLILVAGFLIFKPVYVNAETIKGVELRGSLVLSESEDLEEYNSNNNISFGLGVKLVKKSAGNLFTQIGVDVNYTSVSLESDEYLYQGSIHLDEKMKLISVEAPVLLKMPFNPDDIYSDCLYFGVEPGMILSGKRSGNYLLTVENEVSSGDYDISIGNMRTFYVGVVTGFEMPFKWGNNFYSLDIRYKKNLLTSFENVDDLPLELEDNYPYADKNGNAIDMTLNSFTISITRYF